MRNIKRAGVLTAAALSALLMIGTSPSGAQADLDCGDPGTSHNMPIDPNNDPNGLDADNNGIGCEDASVFGDAPAPSTDPAPPAPEPEPSDTAAPAVPQPGEPTFTG
jgi:hypothetical protein